MSKDKDLAKETQSWFIHATKNEYWTMLSLSLMEIIFQWA